MTDCVLIYRTLAGEADYVFSFELQSTGDIRIYIISQPLYGSRSASAHTTHRFDDGHRKFICWNERITSIEDSLALAAKWAEATQHYISTGQTF